MINKRKIKRKWNNMSKNNKMIILLVSCLMFITVGYASIKQVLTLTGYTSIATEDGMVFTSIGIKENNSATIEKDASIKASTLVNTKISFYGEGSITFNVSAQNQGTTDAKLVEIKGLENTNMSNPSCITASVQEHNVGDIVYPNAIKNFTITITSSCESYSVKEFDLHFVYQKLSTIGGVIPEALGNAVEYLKNNKIETNVDGNENGLYQINQNGDVSSGTDNVREYRYIGPNPDNYVLFNNELWRIVGIFNDKIKLVKETTAFQDILNNPSNFRPEDTSYERLNTEYYNTLSNVSNVAKQTFYTSRQDTTKFQQKEAYNLEKSQNMTYDGHVGLLLPSDYGYAASTSCQVIISDYNQCADKNWMVNGDNFALLAFGSEGSYHSTAPMINASGGTEYYYSGEHTVNYRPILYLKESTEFIGGFGTKEQPYLLKEKETAATYLVNNKVETTIDGNENGLYPVNQSGSYTSDITNVREYRYIGSNPNNYVKFNNELWRMIGVFDGKIKMVRENVIGDYLIQDIRNFVPEQAFYKYLNTEYYSTLTQSEYVNYHTYKLYTAYYSDTAPNLYNREQNGSSTETSDVKAYVYLMTPSDYGYAGSTSCTNTTLNTAYNCADKNWMVSGEKFAILGFSGGSQHITGPLVTETGGVDAYNETMTVNIRPVIYLNPSTMFASGEGSKDNPYILE